MSDRETTPVISVVVPCRGHSRELAECLRGIARQETSWPFETVVVDSASDSEVAATAGEVPGVRLVRAGAPLLAGDARNLGARNARADYLVFVDADAVPEPGWLAVAFAELEDGAELVSGPILDVLPGHPLAVCDNLLQFVEFAPRRPDGPASHFSTCHLAVRRSAFDAIGGFPAKMPVGEDVVFTHAVSERWPEAVRFVRRMKVRHRGRTSLRSYWEHQNRFGYHRGLLGQHLRPIYQRLGARAGMEAAVTVKRFAFVVRRCAQWYPSALLRLTVFWPCLLYGAAAFASGFRRGCREALERSA